jgi:hypothetical protein
MSNKAKTKLETADSSELNQNEAADQPESKQEEPKTVVLKTICAELKLDPKLARRKLRKAWRAENSGISHNLRDRWTGEFIRSVLAPKPKQVETTTEASE